ncbi:MAG: hypothetical protein ACJ74W_18495 [Pyrinomonadaceae bacterium]
MRSVKLILAALYLCGATLVGPVSAQQPARDEQKNPSLKKPEKSAVPPPMQRRRYDRALNVTYVNVDIPLRTRAETKAAGSKGAPVREVMLIFQLVYKGTTTTDLAQVYLFAQSLAGRQEADRLNAVQEIEINAEGYQYSYARANYQTELVEATGGVQGTIPLKREIIGFNMPPDDLSQMTNANSLKIKLGTEQFIIHSPQLTELRRTLVTGGED